MNHSAEYFYNLKAKLVKDFDDCTAKRNGVDCSACKSVFTICDIHTHPTNTESSGFLSWLLRVVYFVDKHSYKDAYGDYPLSYKKAQLSSYKELLHTAKQEMRNNEYQTRSTIIQSVDIEKTPFKDDPFYVSIERNEKSSMINDLIALTADLMTNVIDDNWFEPYDREHPEISTRDIREMYPDSERGNVCKTIIGAFDKLRDLRDGNHPSQSPMYVCQDYVEVICHDGFIMEGKTSAVKERSKQYPDKFAIDSECDLIYRLKPKSLDDCIGVVRPEYIQVVAAYFYALSISTNEIVINGVNTIDLNRSHISHEVFGLKSIAKFNMENYLYSILHRFYFDCDINFKIKIYTLPLHEITYKTCDDLCDNDVGEYHYESCYSRMTCVQAPWPIKDYRNFEQKFYKIKLDLIYAYTDFYFEYDLVHRKLFNPKLCMCASCNIKHYSFWHGVNGGENYMKGLNKREKADIFGKLYSTSNKEECIINPIRRSSSN